MLNQKGKKMKKTLLAALVMATTLGATEVSNNQFSLCEITGKTFANSYTNSQSNLTPKQFCDGIVKSQSSNELMCSFKDLSTICVNQIKSKQK